MSEPNKPFQPKPASRAVSNRFGVAIAGYTFTIWGYELGEGQSVEDCLAPHFWIDCVEKVIGQDKTSPKGRGDEIRVWKPDATRAVYFLIEAIGPGFIRVKPGRDYGSESVTGLPEGVPLTTKWNVGKRGHEVIRKTDNAVMAGPFQTKDTAVAWIADHLKAMAA